MAALFIFRQFGDAAEPATLDYRVVGVQLEVSPAALAVPKRIAESLHVRLSAGADGVSGDAGDGAWVEGTLRGPSFAARRVVGRPNELLLPLPVVGDYQLDNIRLVNAFGCDANVARAWRKPARVCRLPKPIRARNKHGQPDGMAALRSLDRAFETVGGPGWPGTQGLPGDLRPAKFFRSAAAQCWGDDRATWGFPAGEGDFFRRSCVRSVARPCRQAGRVCFVSLVARALGEHGQAFAMHATFFSTIVQFTLP